MGAKFAGKGAIFNRWNTGTSTWVPIAGLKSISGPTCNRETIDVTTLDSVGGYREFIGSLRDAGDVSFNMLFDAAGYSLMKTDFESDTAQKYQIVLPDATHTTLEFYGLVTDLPIDIPVDDAVSSDITIKISGQTTLTNMFIVASVETLADITKTVATQLADVGLPATVEVTFSDDSTDNVAVVWDAGDPMFDGATNDTYTFTGTLTMDDTMINPDGVQATIDVVINIA